MESELKSLLDQWEPRRFSDQEIDLLKQMYARVVEMQSDFRELREDIKLQKSESNPLEVVVSLEPVMDLQVSVASGKGNAPEGAVVEEKMILPLRNFVEQVVCQKFEISVMGSSKENPAKELHVDEMIHGYRFSHTILSKKKLRVRKTSVKRRYHRTRIKQSRGYCSVKQKQERAHFKGTRSFVDTCLKLGSISSDFGFQSQETDILKLDGFVESDMMSILYSPLVKMVKRGENTHTQSIDDSSLLEVHDPCKKQSLYLKPKVSMMVSSTEQPTLKRSRVEKENKEGRSLRCLDGELYAWDPGQFNPSMKLGKLRQSSKTKETDQVDDVEFLELDELGVRELLSSYEFHGDDIMSISGSALLALETLTENLNVKRGDNKWVDKSYELMDVVDRVFPIPQRQTKLPFLLVVNDVFSITDHGTVATGRGERGTLKVGEAVDSVDLRETRSYTIQGVKMFPKILDEALACGIGGVLLSGIQKAVIQRGMVLAKPGLITPQTKFEAVMYVFKKGGRYSLFFAGYMPQFCMRTNDVTCQVKSGCLERKEVNDALYKLHDSCLRIMADTFIVPTKEEWRLWKFKENWCFRVNVAVEGLMKTWETLIWKQVHEEQVLKLSATVKKTATHSIAEDMVNKADRETPKTRGQLTRPSLETWAAMDGRLVAVNEENLMFTLAVSYGADEENLMEWANIPNLSQEKRVLILQGKMIGYMSVLGVKLDESSFGFLTYLYARKGVKEKISERNVVWMRFWKVIKFKCSLQRPETNLVDLLEKEKCGQLKLSIFHGNVLRVQISTRGELSWRWRSLFLDGGHLSTGNAYIAQLSSQTAYTSYATNVLRCPISYIFETLGESQGRDLSLAIKYNEKLDSTWADHMGKPLLEFAVIEFVKDRTQDEKLLQLYLEDKVCVSEESKGIERGLALVFISELFHSLRPPEKQLGEMGLSLIGRIKIFISGWAEWRKLIQWEESYLGRNKLTAQLENELIKSMRRRVEKCRRLTEAQCPYKNTLEKMIRVAMSRTEKCYDKLVLLAEGLKAVQIKEDSGFKVLVLMKQRCYEMLKSGATHKNLVATLRACQKLATREAYFQFLPP